MVSDLHEQSDHAQMSTYNVFSDVQADQFQYLCQDKSVCKKFFCFLEPTLYQVVYIGSEVIFPIRFKLWPQNYFTVFHINLSLGMCRSPKSCSDFIYCRFRVC